MKKKYVVHKANIMDDEGNKRHHGEVVELESSTARHYNSKGFLRPFFEDDQEDSVDDDNGDDVEAREETKPIRPRRTTLVQNPAQVPADTAPKQV